MKFVSNILLSPLGDITRAYFHVLILLSDVLCQRLSSVYSRGFLRSAVAFECCGARAPFKQDIRIKCSIRDAVCSYICSYICLLPGFVVKCQYLFDM